MISTKHLSEVREGLKGAIAGIHATRQTVFEAALEIGEAFHAKRVEISAGEFSNLSLLVRSRQEGRSIQIGWVLYHFRKGKRTGLSTLPKPRATQEYDIATIKRHSPEWLHALAIETEQACRPLRETLKRLTDAEREMRVCAARFGIDASTLSPAVPTHLDAGEVSSNDDSYVDPFHEDAQ